MATCISVLSYVSWVDLVMAIGDSMTAAFAAEGGIWEYRDESFSIGQGEGKQTLPNYIKQFSPNVYGGSVKDHFPEVSRHPA